jgi:hypothetical protein
MYIEAAKYIAQHARKRLASETAMLITGIERNPRFDLSLGIRCEVNSAVTD